MYGLNLVFLYWNIFIRDNVAKKSHLYLIEIILFQVGIQQIFLSLVQNWLKSFYIVFFFIFGIDKDIIQVYNNKNIKLLYQDLIDISLKYSWYIDQLKSHYLIFKIALVGSESCLLFIVFLNLHSMINISEIKLGKISSLAKPV